MRKPLFFSAVRVPSAVSSVLIGTPRPTHRGPPALDGRAVRGVARGLGITAIGTFGVALGASLGFVAACSSSDPDPSTITLADGGKPNADGGTSEDDAATGFDGAATPTCIEATGAGDPGPTDLNDDGDTAAVTVTAGATACERSFELTSTAVRRDDLPKSPRVVAESADRPSLQTRSPLFDALYQLALDEARENSVAEIKDGAFRNGAALACGPDGCFETGRKWNYVWTRDTSYAVDLGMAWIDPLRAKSSLDFKLSTRRDGTDLQIVQDTGTGGSYPVSSDRTVWALGAREVLQHLTGAARDAFRDRALSAIKGTIEHDRAVVFDATDGLYRGEQSFLDWREQTYPSWTSTDTVEIAASKSLSTNVAHLALLETGAELADEVADKATADDLRAKATALRVAIRTKFWLAEDKQLSTFVPTALDPAPVRRYDLLGTSLAVLFDVPTADQARDAIANYPTLAKGPPVIFPQQKDTAIYHNRAIWPFVTGYAVRAARKVGNDAAFDAGIASLVRGAALNLSNMENLELVSGKPYVDDGANSGPVVNSQRQLWSVGAFIGAVHGSIFGVEATKTGIHVAPFVTAGLRKSLFGGAESIVLNNVPLRGKAISVVVRLPKDAGEAGAYSVAKVTINGVVAPDGNIADADLASRNLVEVELGAPAPAQSVKRIDSVADYRSIFAPKTPAIGSVALAGGKLSLAFDIAGEAAADVTLSVYRDGVRVAKDLPGNTTSWTDDATNGEATPSHCYTLESRYAVSGNASQHARAACFWGTGNPRITTIPASNFVVSGGSATTAYGRYFYEAWGDPGHQIVGSFTAQRTGAHLVQATYGNGAGAINTGITCAVKHVTVEEFPGGAVVGDGYMLMPQRGDWSSWGNSSFVRATLTAGKNYRIRLAHDDRAVNMSAFSHFDAYTGGTGGVSGAFFRVNVAELKVLSLVP